MLLQPTDSVLSLAFRIPPLLPAREVRGNEEDARKGGSTMARLPVDVRSIHSPGAFLTQRVLIVVTRQPRAEAMVVTLLVRMMLRGPRLLRQARREMPPRHHEMQTVTSKLASCGPASCM